MKTETIDRILSALWERSRFASYFFQSVQCVPSESVPTLAMAMRSGSQMLYFNDAFINSLPHEETIGLLIHEMMHLVLSHDHRASPGDDRYLQNLAQDMVVNDFLLSRSRSFFSRRDEYSREWLDLILPAGLPVIPKRFFEATGLRDPLWEEVYRWLRQLSMQERIDISVSGDSGMPSPSAGNVIAEGPDDAFLSTVPLSYVYEQSRPLSFEGMTGLVMTDHTDRVLPTGIHILAERNDLLARESKRSRLLSLAGTDIDCGRERFFNEITGIIKGIRKSDISSWRHLLKSIVDYSSQTIEWQYTYGRFNRRYFAGGMYVPGRLFKEQMLLTVALDVSGSMVMNPDDIGSAFGVIEELLGKYRVRLVCLDEDLFIPELRVDTFIRGNDPGRHYLYRRGDWRHLTTGIGGTTLFAPLFNRYMKGHRETLVVITDGYIYDIERLAHYTPTIWLVPGGREEPFLPTLRQVRDDEVRIQRHAEQPDI